MIEQMTIWDFLEESQPNRENTLEPGEDKLLSTGSRVLEEKGFSYIAPISVNSEGAMAFRSTFEDKPCIVQIDKEGHIMFKHDDSLFWDFGGSV